MEDEEDLYDCVYDDEDGGEIYEDLMKTEALPPPVSSFPPSLPCGDAVEPFGRCRSL